MVYSKRPVDAPGLTGDAMGESNATMDVEEQFARSSLYAPPSNVSTAYDNTGSDPLGCFKQAGQMLNQQHYLDGKYHGTANTLVQMIHTKTGDKEMTKRIVTVAAVGCVVLIVVFFSLAISSDAKLRKTSKADFDMLVAMHDDSIDFDPNLSDIAKLLRHPETEYKHFDAMYGKWASVKVITSAQPRFEPGDVVELLSHPLRNSMPFDSKYGKDAAEKLLSGHAGRDRKKMKALERKLRANRGAPTDEEEQDEEDADPNTNELDSIDTEITKQKIRHEKERKADLETEEALTVQEEQADVEAEGDEEEGEEDDGEESNSDLPSRIKAEMNGGSA